MKKIIHVNMHIIKQNRKKCGARLWVETSGKVEVIDRDGSATILS